MVKLLLQYWEGIIADHMGSSMTCVIFVENLNLNDLISCLIYV